MATLFTIPQTTLSIGAHNFGPHNVAGAIKQYVITLDVGLWPFTGGEAFTYSCESSGDNGVTWQIETSGGVTDNSIPAKFGNPANQIKIVCPIRGTGARKVRFQSTWAKSLTISGSIAAN